MFTEYAATLDWIAGVLAQRGYRDVLKTIQGSTPTDERELIRAQFTEEPAKHPVRVPFLIFHHADADGSGRVV